MTMLKRQQTPGRALRGVLTILTGVFAAALVGCEGPGDNDGTVITGTVLPTDVVLDLYCENAGVFPEPCVLDDPQNPYATTPIIEPGIDAQNANKFELFDAIPPGPEGAKARFYLWATALASFPSGENQFGVANALHELWDANGDPLIQDQALKAYRSQLDNFFGTVTVFTCCEVLRPPGDDRGPIPFPVGLNELTADSLYRTDSTGYRRLVEGDPLLVIERLLEWGYGYQIATPPSFDNGLVTILEFP